MKLSRLSPFLKLIALIVIIACSVYILSNLLQPSSADKYTSVIREGILARDPTLIKFEDDKVTDKRLPKKQRLESLITPHERESKDQVLHDKDTGRKPSTNQSANSKVATKDREKDDRVLYAVVNGLAGQQGAGMHSLVSFQRLMARLSNNYSAQILEPAFVNTEYQGLYSPHQDSIHFHDLFDMDYFNSASKSAKFPPLMLRTKFFAEAPKFTVYVTARQLPGGTEQILRTSWTANSGDSCYQGYVPKKELLQQAGFCVKRVIAVSFVSYIRDTEKLREAIFDKIAQEHRITIVFNEWRHYWLMGDLDFRTTLRPGPRLISDVEFYEKTFLNSSNDVAVMFRLEHIIRFLSDQRKNKTSKNEWTIEKCLQKGVETTLNLASKSYGRPMVTVDLGKYGSATYYQILRKDGYDAKKVMENTKSILSPLFGNDKTDGFKNWEESFSQASKGVENGAYIAALQRTLASRAKCLILVGGGMFQQMSFDDYIVNHPRKEDQCFSAICSSRIFTS